MNKNVIYKIIIYVAVAGICIVLFKVVLTVLAKFAYLLAFLVVACMIALLYVPEKQIEHYSPKTAKLVSKIKTIISGNKKV